MKKGFTKLMGLGFAALLAACGNAQNAPETGSEVGSGANGNGVQETTENGTVLFSVDDFNQAVSNTNAVIEGGTLNFGIVSDTALPGVFNPAFNQFAVDTMVMDFFMGSLLDIDENFMITQDGAATWTVSEDGTTFTFTIHDNVYWHDGEPVTAQDWVFAHEVLAHPDYDGVRFGPNQLNIVGMQEFVDGEADHIEGLRILDERVLEMEFIDVTPALLVGAGGIWPNAMPYHIFSEIPVAEMSSSAAVRQNPIGFGPFKVTNVVPGEGVSLVRNENYWQGAPNLEGINVRVVNPSLVAVELENGNIDVVQFPVAQFEHHYDMSNVEFLGELSLRYDFVGFKLGEWDGDLGENVMNPDAKMADVNLRLAMWKAVDNSAVANQIFNGLRQEATTLIPPSHPLFHAEDLERPAFDPAAAEAILEAAGFVDVDGDGFREDQNGEPLVINFWAMTGDEIQDALVMFYVQSWQAIGLNVNLSQMEANSFFEHVETDYEGIDVYLAGWQVGSNVDPYGLYGRTALWNESRFVSENQDRLLAAGMSVEAALDLAYRQAVMHEWQAYMLEQIPVFPTLYHITLTAVNNRVAGFAIGAGNGPHWHEVGVTSETAYTH